MHCARIVCRLTFALFAFLLCGALSAHQSSKENSAGQHPYADAPSLKICLRLSDDSPFSGLANLHVVSGQGSELPGETTDSEGEAILPNLAAGSYSVEASAPGFVSVKQTVEIKLGRGIETLFLIMRPDTFPDNSSIGLFGAANENAAFHILPGVDAVVPKVWPGVSCDLPVVLRGVGERITQLVSNLEKFSATEHIEHYGVDKKGMLHSRETRSFEYLVLVSQNPVQGFQLDEYRNGSTDPSQFPAGIATNALPAMALIFHPLMMSEFNFSCEGLGRWAGRPAWQIRFEQRQDRQNRIRYYKIQGNYYPVALKGRAWIDAATYQMLRLETDLIRPVSQIDLTYERLSIEYGEVQFHSRALRLWLPATAELYWERHGRRYYRRHSFRNFKVFVVDTNQKFQQPKESYSFTNASDRDVPGVLIVTPISGSKFNAVSIAFIVPAGRSVFKTIGTGKDVDIPSDLVGSAKYVYKGTEGEVKVDASLAAESTLEVVSDPSP